MNGHGKCLASSANWSNNGNKLITWDCLNEMGLFWTVIGDGHICNGHNKCIASPQNSYGNENLIQWESLDENGQKWQWFNGDQIMNRWGKCLATAQIALRGTPEWLGEPVWIGNWANIGTSKISKRLKLNCVEVVAVRNTDPVRMDLETKTVKFFQIDLERIAYYENCPEVFKCFISPDAITLECNALKIQRMCYQNTILMFRSISMLRIETCKPRTDVQWHMRTIHSLEWR